MPLSHACQVLPKRIPVHFDGADEEGPAKHDPTAAAEADSVGTKSQKHCFHSGVAAAAGFDKWEDSQEPTFIFQTYRRGQWREMNHIIPAWNYFSRVVNMDLRLISFLLMVS